MALTDVTFNYNVAKIIDTPWNTIINGLNYTKTNLAPLALKYTLCNNYDTGMLLKEVAGNSIKQYVPMEDFSWSNAVIDYDDVNKYWILNTNHKSTNTSGPCVYLAQKYTDENGFDYSVITDALPGVTKYRNCGQIWYQDSTCIFIYLNQTYYSSGQNAYLYRCYKNKDTGKLEIRNTYTCTNGIMSLLEIHNGKIVFLKQYGTSSTNHDIYTVEISSGIEKSIHTHSTNGQGILTSYPTNIINNCFYIKDCPNNLWYKYELDSVRSSASHVTIPCDIDDANFSSTSVSYAGQIKRFTHVYVEGDKHYLMILSLSSYNYNTTLSDSLLQVYEITDIGLQRKQNIVVDGLSLIPKNNWNTLFIGTLVGIKVFSWNPLECNFTEKPSIYTTCQQFGFDGDERLWIMDAEENIFRYTYNQPVTVDYKFEKVKYELGTDFIESYVDVSVLNYMGNVLSSKLTIKAVGNFTFENNKKELTVQLTSNEYLRLPIIIKGTGKYEIRL